MSPELDQVNMVMINVEFFFRQKLFTESAMCAGALS